MVKYNIKDAKNITYAYFQILLAVDLYNETTKIFTKYLNVNQFNDTGIEILDILHKYEGKEGCFQELIKVFPTLFDYFPLPYYLKKEDYKTLRWVEVEFIDCHNLKHEVELNYSN